MRLAAQSDLDLPIEQAFREAADIVRLERQLLRRGIGVMRTDTLAAPGPGMGWAADLPVAGTLRPVTGTLTVWEPPARAVLSADAARLDGELSAEFTALSRQATRVRVALNLRATTLRDRMMLGGMQISRRRLERRFAEIVRDYLDVVAARAARV